MVRGFACDGPNGRFKRGYNDDIIDNLEKMTDIYATTKDKFRELGYRKAITAIRKYPKRLESGNEASKLFGVGQRLAEKIQEILTTGTTRKLVHMTEDDTSIPVLQLFTTVHGIGPDTAQKFYAAGHRTLDDLRSNATLSRSQIIGLKYHSVCPIPAPSLRRTRIFRNEFRAAR